MKQEVPTGVIVGVIALLVVFAGVFLFKAATGGVKGDGHAGQIAADPFPRGAASQPMALREQQAKMAKSR